jgi:hypothetical protein
MIKYEKCMYCGSDKIEKGYVNTHIAINGPERAEYGVTSQIVYSPTDGFICKDCGYVAFFLDWEKTRR